MDHHRTGDGTNLFDGTFAKRTCSHSSNPPTSVLRPHSIFSPIYVCCWVQSGRSSGCRPLPLLTQRRRSWCWGATAMTAADPVASKLLDRTGVCGARRGTLSQREMVTGRACDRRIGSTKRGDRYADCRIRTGFALDRPICYATGDRKWSSGESRLRTGPMTPAIRYGR